MSIYGITKFIQTITFTKFSIASILTSIFVTIGMTISNKIGFSSFSEEQILLPIVAVTSFLLIAFVIYLLIWDFKERKSREL